MADLNAFPNKELEDLNLKIKERVNNVLKNINTDSLNQKVKTKLDELKLTTSTVETGDDETWSGTTFVPNKRYLDTLPSEYKNKIYRYYDIFRDNSEVVSDYVSLLQKHGSEKAAKEAGADNVLLYPKKLKKYINDNVETITEDTQKRWEFLDNFGEHDYDIKIR